MDNLIRNASLVLSTVVDGLTTEITIKKKFEQGHQGTTHLSDVFNYIPHGIVHKEETGMGATYLELETKRNSIIVEPIKITASSKAQQHNALYVGTKTEFHPKNTSTNNIIGYVNSNNITSVAL